jgi:hypothetical protein
VAGERGEIRGEDPAGRSVRQARDGVERRLCQVGPMHGQRHAGPEQGEVRPGRKPLDRTVERRPEGQQVVGVAAGEDHLPVPQRQHLAGRRRAAGVRRGLALSPETAQRLELGAVAGRCRCGRHHGSAR